MLFCIFLFLQQGTKLATRTLAFTRRTPGSNAGVWCFSDFKLRDVSPPLASLHGASDANVYDSVSLYEDPCPPPRPSTDALKQGMSADAVEPEQIDWCVTAAAVNVQSEEGAEQTCVQKPGQNLVERQKHARTCAKKLRFTISRIVFSFTSPHGGIRLSQHAQTETIVDANRVALKESLCNFMVSSRTRVSQALSGESVRTFGEG